MNVNELKQIIHEDCVYCGRGGAMSASVNMIVGKTDTMGKDENSNALVFKTPELTYKLSVCETCKQEKSAKINKDRPKNILSGLFFVILAIAAAIGTVALLVHFTGHWKIGPLLGIILIFIALLPGIFLATIATEFLKKGLPATEKILISGMVVEKGITIIRKRLSVNYPNGMFVAKASDCPKIQTENRRVLAVRDKQRRAG